MQLSKLIFITTCLIGLVACQKDSVLKKVEESSTTDYRDSLIGTYDGYTYLNYVTISHWYNHQYDPSWIVPVPHYSQTDTVLLTVRKVTNDSLKINVMNSFFHTWFYTLKEASSLNDTLHFDLDTPDSTITKCIADFFSGDSVHFYIEYAVSDPSLKTIVNFSGKKRI